MPTPSERPTLRFLAKLAGVSPMCVSMALRNHSQLPLATRERIQKLARNHGYTPDPTVQKLMHHLRTRPGARTRATLCAVVFRPWATSYPEELLAGAKQRAHQLGYGFDEIEFKPLAGNLPRLQAILRNRGVEGILITPSHELLNDFSQLPWNDFSVVSGTYSVLNLPAHRVVPHLFANCARVLAELQKLGYRRIGLAITSDHDRGTQHYITSALAWHQLHGGGEKVRPFIFARDGPDKLRSWYQRARPDVIVTDHDLWTASIAKDLGLEVPGDIGFACLSIEPGSRLTGVATLPGDIGRKAVDVLADLILRGEKGLPDVPTTTMIEGRWSRGESTRQGTASPS